jgi:hypothetical protein
MATMTRSGSSGSSEVVAKAKGPALAAGAAAVGLAVGSHIGGRRKGLSRLVAPRRKVLGVPLGRKSGLHRTVETLGKAVQGVGSATRQVSSTTDDIRQVREELERANRQSPVEVLLNALTHRRGAHRQED